MKIVFGGAKNDMTRERLAQWQAEFPGVDMVLTASPAEQVAAAPGADAWIGRITRDAFLAAGSQLKWVHSTGAGIEKLTAIPELVASDVIVTNSRGSHAASVAEHTFALLLGLTRRLPDLCQNQRDHVYRNPGVAGGLQEISGMTMLIIGFGNLGRAIARRALAFDMQVTAVDMYPGAVPAGVSAVVPIDRLDEVLPTADVVVVAVPYTPETAHLLDSRRIGMLQRGAILIAVSRGGIVDDQALAEALRQGQLGGAGLDVQGREPVPDGDPLWDVPGLIISPHCSGTSRQTTERVWQGTHENLRRFVHGEKLENICDKQAGF